MTGPKLPFMGGCACGAIRYVCSAPRNGPSRFSATHARATQRWGNTNLTRLAALAHSCAARSVAFLGIRCSFRSPKVPPWISCRRLRRDTAILRFPRKIAVFVREKGAVSDYGSEGCRFNSYWVRHYNNNLHQARVALHSRFPAFKLADWRQTADNSGSTPPDLP
jgi:hypothetical protein